MPLADLVYTGIPLGDPANIAGYIGTPLNKRNWNCPTLECHWGDYNSPHTIQAHIVKQSSIHASLKWQDGGTQGTSGQISVNLAFTWSLLLSTVYQFCSSNMWLVQHHFVHALDISTIIAFVYLGLQYKLNQLSSNNSRHTSCIHRGCMLGSDLTQWPPNQTLPVHWVYHWADCTGTTLADAIVHRSSSGNPMLICIIGTHWNTAGATSTLGCQRNHTGRCQHPVVSQRQFSVNSHNWNTLDHHWKTIGSTLETHWLPIILSPVVFQCTLGSKF